MDCLRKNFALVLLFGIFFLASVAQAQDRVIGAGGFAADDGFDHTVTIVAPPGMTTSYIYTLPPYPGSSILSGYVEAGTAIGQTLYWNGSYWQPTGTGSTGQVLQLNGSDIPTWVTVPGAAAVTSVDVSGGSTGLTTSGGPITNTGVITLAGTLAIGNGGTGATTANGALNALLPSQAGNNGLVLMTNGSNTSWQAVSGTGTVTSITAGTGLNGGTITTSGIISLANTPVTAGAYTNANITVDAQGRITAAQSGPTSGTVTTVSASAPLSVTNPTTTPAITLGIVPANLGGTGMSASSGADFLRGDGVGGWTLGTIQSGDLPFLNGDVTGSIGSNSISALQGKTISTAGLAVGNVLVYSGSQWTPVPGSITITPGTGLSGGGTVSLGNSVTLVNEGILSISSGGGIIANAVAGAVTLGSSAGGDLSGSVSDLTINTIQSIPITATGASNGQVLKYNAGSGSWQPADDANSGGTVTSVSASLPLSVTNPTTTPALTLGTVPIANGGTGIITPPSSNQFLRDDGSGNWTTGVVHLNSADVSNILAIANGGTGQNSANAALNALMPSQGGNSGKVLETDGTNTSWQTVTGTGTVTNVSAGAIFTVTNPTTTPNITLTGLVPIANGGTNASTANGAINNLLPSQASNSGKVLQTDGTNVSWAVSGIGTVTSVSASAPLSVSNSTTTPSITLGTVTIANGGTGQITQQTAIDALTGPQSSGKYLRSDGIHSTISSIQAADVPTLNQNTTGSAANVTGIVAIANGGTGQTSTNAAINALLPSQGGNNGKFLTTDGSNTSWATVSGTGTVTSVGVSGGSTGLTTTGGPITTSGTITLSGTLGAANGGTGLSSYISGDLLYASGSTSLSKLSVGANPDGYVLTLSGGMPTWQSASGGGSGWGLAGNAISSGNFFGTTNAQDLVFKTNNTEHARITSSGKIGIGTSTPASEIEVANGNIAVTNSNNTAGELQMSEPSSHGSHYTSFKAQNQNASVTYTLPAAGSSTAGDVLTNNGSNTLSWAQPIPPGMVVTFNSDSNHAGFTYLATTTITTSNGAWVQDSSLDSNLEELCATSIGGKLYTIGGYSEDWYGNSNELAAYDTATGSWTQKSVMNEARYEFTAVALGGKIYAIQGYNDNDGYLDSLEVYDTGTDTWTIKSSAPNYDYWTTAAVGSDGKIYVMGGGENPSSFLQYDPSSDMWTTLTDLTSEQSRYAAAAVAIDSFIYLIGGYQDSYPWYLNRVDVYNVNSGVWTTAASMHDTRYGFQAAVANRHIYVAGCEGGSAEGTSNAEEYDPATNTWTPISPTPDAVEDQPGLAAVGNKVFMVDGYDESNYNYNNLFELTPPTYIYLNYFSKN